MVSQLDREIIRSLADQWREQAALPVMTERKRLWRAVNDLRAERPVILFETAWIEDYVAQNEILCQDPFLRSVEQNLRITLRQAAELRDDIVIEPYYRLGWRMKFSDYGVPIAIHPALGKSIAYTFNFPIAKPDEIARLRPRTFAVDKEETFLRRDMLQDVMGDVLPIVLGNYDPFVYEFDVGPYGDVGFTGDFFFGLTWQLYRLIGNQGLLYWVYDAPEAIHKLMAYLLDDRLRLFDFVEQSGVLAFNTDSQMAGPRAYGYASELPAADSPRRPTLKDVWGWAESQESENLSPAMFKEFALPYLAKLAERFGLIYYGCCERIDDRLEMIVDAVPNLRSVSVSGWSNLAKTAAILGKKYVYSRKPTPAYISGPHPVWDLLEKDLKATYAAARDCNLQLLFRDVYTTCGDRTRLRRWVDLAKSIFQM